MDSTLQSRLHLWRQRNFPNATPEDQLIGAMEELGELAKANLKRRTQIRGPEHSHAAREEDAVGDIVTFLAGYCSLRGFNLLLCWESAAAHVTQRDWIKYPKDGLSE